MAEDDVPDRVIAPLLEESLDDLYEHAPCGYLSSLPDGPIVKVNETFLEWTGHRREGLVGVRRFEELLTPGGRIYHETHYAPLLRMQGSVREIALQIVRADGSRLPVLINSTLRTSDAGTVVRTTVFDASDRRSYERELLDARRRETEARQRTERLQRLAEALAGATEEGAVAAAALETVVEALEAMGGTLTATAADGAAVTLAAAGEASGDAVEELELPGSRGPVGRLRLRFAEPPELSDADSAFLLAAARQCGQALERASLFAETRRAGRRSAFLAEMAHDLASTQELEARARRVVELVAGELAAGARLEIRDAGGRPKVLAQAGTSGGGTLELPLLARGRRLGTLILRDPFELDTGGADFLSDVAARAALGIENARLYEHERQVARALQESMLTRELPRDARFALATYYQPALETMEVGGDWYDAFPLPGGRLAVVVGDVVGRGIEAASAMGQLRSAVRALAGAGLDPARVLERLDDFVEHVEIARSATLVYADVDLATGGMRYACAGHPPPVLVPGDGDAVLLWDGRSPPLGAHVGLAERPEAETRLATGSRLVLYTDGLVERRGIPIDDGIDALVAALDEHRAAPLGSVVDRIPRSLLAGHRGSDDVCLLAMAFGATERFQRTVEARPTELAPLRADLRAWLDAGGVDPEERNAVVLACSEAVSNAIEHGCGMRSECGISIEAAIEEGTIVVAVHDEGAWREPPEETDRGRGLVLIRNCMDDIDIRSERGTTVSMRRAIERRPA